MSTVIIDGAEVQRIASRMGTMNSDISAITTELYKACGKLKDNIKTDQLTDAYADAQDFFSSMAREIDTDITRCATFLTQKAQSYGEIDEEYEKNLNDVQNEIDNINIQIYE